MSPIARDARVLRQIACLSRYYDLSIIGYGPSSSEYKEHKNIHWLEIYRPLPSFKRKTSDLIRLILMILGKPDRPWVLKYAIDSKSDVYHKKIGIRYPLLPSLPA